MYELYTPGSKITLWCNGRSDANPEPSSKRRKTNGAPVSITTNSSSETEDNVDQVFKNLKIKHPDMESPKFRLWTRLIDRGDMMIMTILLRFLS